MSLNNSLKKAINSPSSKPLSFLIILFSVSRIILFYIGFHFNLSALPLFPQFIDPLLLKNSLLQSIYYFHIQPPLLNLFIGIILKLFPQTYPQVFHFIFLMLGLVSTISIFLILTWLRVNSKLSVLLTTLFMINPGAVLSESYLFYDYPTITLLCLSAVFLYKFLHTNKFYHGLIFFMLLSLLALTRSLFHISWFVLIVLLLLAYQKGNRKRIILAAIAPFILILLLYLKNFFVFGFFNSTSWLGLNFSMATTFQLPLEERQALIKEGKLSPLAIIPISSKLKDYPDYLLQSKNTNIPVLDQEIKSTNYINYNNLSYINICKQYLKDALYVLVSHPRAYLKGILKSYNLYFNPGFEFTYYNEKCINKIMPLIKSFNLLFYGQLLSNYDYPRYKTNDFFKFVVYKLSNLGLFFICWFIISLIYSLRTAFAKLSKKEALTSKADLIFTLTVLFLCLNVIYVTLISNILSEAENFRYRFMIEPFLIILLAITIQGAINRNKLRRGQFKA